MFRRRGFRYEVDAGLRRETHNKRVDKPVPKEHAEPYLERASRVQSILVGPVEGYSIEPPCNRIAPFGLPAIDRIGDLPLLKLKASIPEKLAQLNERIRAIFVGQDVEISSRRDIPYIGKTRRFESTMSTPSAILR